MQVSDFICLVGGLPAARIWPYDCLLYTSDAADERSSVDLGGRRIIKKKNKEEHADRRINGLEKITKTSIDQTQWNTCHTALTDDKRYHINNITPETKHT